MTTVFRLLLLISTALPFTVSAIDADPIRLENQAIRLADSDYYIKSIRDERKNRSGIGSIYIQNDIGKQALSTVDLYNGVEQAFGRLILGNRPKATSKPINVRILEFKITESPEPGRISGQIDLKLGFSTEITTGEKPLVVYSTGARYTRSLSAGRIIEPAIRNLLSKGIKFMDGWLTENAPVNPDLAASLKISISDHQEMDADTLYYRETRPLTWSDFRGKAQPGRFAAAVFPSFGYDMERSIAGHEIQVNLNLRVYMVRSASWYNSAMVNAQSLAHEQMHFDIARIVANRFRQKILDAGLNPDNYEAFISMEYFEAYREMNRLQKQYDEETGHGTNPSAQDRWNAWIEKELSRHAV